MSAFDIFLALVRTGRRLGAAPKAEVQDVQEDDLDFVLGEHTRRKWGDVRSYGPGQAEAKTQAPDHPREKHRRRRPSKAERLQRKLERLKADVQKLEKASK